MKIIDPHVDLGHQVNRLARLMRAGAQRAQESLNLTPPQAAVLLHLSDGSAMTMGDLADRVGIDRPTLTGIADRLKRDGWVDVSVNEDDHRSRLICLSKDGSTRCKQVVDNAHRASNVIAGDFSKAEMDQLLDLLVRAGDAYEAWLMDVAR